jgi:hypothetical protein
MILADGLAEDKTDDESGRPALIRPAKITYRRIPYEFETTLKKIRDRCG